VIHRLELLDALERAPARTFEGIAWRHMFGGKAPDTENTTGARWNPAGVAAIYLSLTRDGAIAEGDHAVAVQPLRPRARRFVYSVDLTLATVLDLSDPRHLTTTGLTMEDIASDDHTACRELGAAADWLEHDGLLVPSTRSTALTLVVYPAHRESDARFIYEDGNELIWAQ
jgi:RES domain-containing protein